MAIQLPKQPAVICRGIAKSYDAGGDKVVALRGIDLTVNKGEVAMLVGPSGCGKTTLISIMAGILRPDSGSCAVFDAEFAKLPSGALISFRAKNIGFIFQSYNLLPGLTIEENVAIPLIINGIARAQAMRQAHDLLGEVGLGDRGEEKPPMLSGGQQQRVAIARALVHKPGLLVCDEPTSALDHEAGARIMDLMSHAVRERGATLVIVTHDNRIFEYADRIAYMDDGRIVRIGDNTSSPPPSTSHARSEAP